MDCELNTVSPSVAQKVLQLLDGSSICHGVQEAWGDVVFSSSGGTALLRAVIQPEHTERI